jgi:hypothetical protein
MSLLTWTLWLLCMLPAMVVAYRLGRLLMRALRRALQAINDLLSTIYGEGTS